MEKDRPSTRHRADPLPEIRCGHCDKLLARGRAFVLQIKCSRCGTLNHLKAESLDPNS